MRLPFIRRGRVLHRAFGLSIIGVTLLLVSLQDVTVTVPAGRSAAVPKGAAPKRKVTKKDLPRIPPTQPDDALKTFELAEGFELQLVAAEPMMGDPVDACFDADGRMFVAEMHGYPFSQEPTRLNPQGGGLKDAGIIRLLEDTNGDGRMDNSTVFAKDISWPVSVCCYNGGLFVLAPQYLYYFKDTDGDDKADVREVVLSGFGRGNVQALANNLKWGLDNKIYFAAGRNGGKIQHRGKPLLTLGRHDLRFDPKTESFERITGGKQFGLSFDDWGNRFVCSNSNHIQQVVYERRHLARNPYLAVSNTIRGIAADGAASRVFRISPPEPWRIIRQKWRAAAKGYKLVVGKDGAWQFIPLDPSKKKGGVPTEYPVGYFTSATGITIYRGGAYPPEFRGNAFIGDVGGNLVHRKRLERNGVVFNAVRADKNTEFIRSSDNWFRPVNFVNAPDGTLYVLDMYRETIEHPHSIPVEIKRFLHLTSGRNRGRIYRIADPQMKRIRPPRLSEMSSKQLVAQLESDNIWNRQTAQRLLWEREDKSVVSQLTQLARSSAKPRARLHALYTLQALDSLKPSLLQHALSDKHPRVVEHAVRLSEPFLTTSGDLVDAVAALCRHDDDRIRFQAALSLGEADGHDKALAGLVRLAKDPRNGQEIRTALLSSVAGAADELTARLLADSEFLQQRHAASLLSELGVILGSNRKPEPVLRLLSVITDEGHSPAIQHVVLSGLGEGLSRRGSSIAQLLASKRTPADVRKRVGRLFEQAARTAKDTQRPLMQRISAIGLLAFADYETASRHLSAFLSPQTPQALGRAAVAALARQDSDKVATLLLSGWRSYTPQLRRDVVDALLSSTGHIAVLLKAVENKRVRHGDLSRDKKQQLVNHPNKTIRRRARKLFGAGLKTDRSRVVAAYRNALNLQGDVKRGRKLFRKNCSVCHRVGDVGHRVAPELASVKNKSPDDLLIAILDPNREAQPNFNVYTVISKQGKIYTGIIAAETASSITLRRAERKEDVILRSNIDRIVSSGKSLMPEGLEKDLSRQDLADVIAFVRTIKSKESNRQGGGGAP